MRFRFAVLLFVVMAFAISASAQGTAQPGDASPQCMPGMKMPGCPDTLPVEPSAAGHGLMTMQPPDSLLQRITTHSGSGTSVEPISTPTPMLMRTWGSWMFMFHANAFLLDQQQSGPRGSDKFFSSSWLMPMAQRQIGRGLFTVRTMLSLDPATITQRQYPLLFQQGETVYGRPIVDGQHPHDLFMELALLYDLKLSAKSLLSFYVAPIGDPALGPTAFSHRASASENPLATLGHHQEDSTHVAADVATVGFTYDRVRLEASGFHGREPDENRWNIDQGRIDSWSTRATVSPARGWIGQVSFGRIASPEALSPGDDQERITASLAYNRDFARGNWASTLLWGRTKSLPDHDIYNSFLLESTLRFRSDNYAWTRIENAERSSELLFTNGVVPIGFHESPIGRVQAYTLGYDHDFHVIPRVLAALGGQFTVYGTPSALQPAYGNHPVGVTVFVRLRPSSE